MRRTTLAISTAVAGLLAAGTVGLAGPAVAAAPSAHYATARADWKKGSHVSAAEENRYWNAARHQLAAYGTRYVHERSALRTLAAIPLTDTTAKQRATAARVTRELNGFFHTAGLYGVAAGNARAYARSYWITSNQVIAAHENTWLFAAGDELAAYGQRYVAERRDLRSLALIPLTDTTAKQRATARRDLHALDKFFHTPGLGF